MTPPESPNVRGGRYTNDDDHHHNTSIDYDQDAAQLDADAAAQQQRKADEAIIAGMADPTQVQLTQFITIPDWLSRREQRITTGEFMFAEHKWCLLVYPHGNQDPASLAGTFTTLAVSQCYIMARTLRRRGINVFFVKTCAWQFSGRHHA
jgi:hypothetical protein